MRIFWDARREPDWLVQRRREAWQRFEATPLPHSGQEEWRRTDLRLFRLERFGFPTPALKEEALPASLLAEGIELGGRATTLDSHAVEESLDPHWAKQGVLFGSLDRLVQEHETLLRPYLLRNLVDPSYDKFAALQTACWTGGTLLYVPRGVAVTQPLHMLSALSANGVDLGHTLVVLEEGAEATLLAETASSTPDAPGLHVGAIEILVGPGAKLRYVNLQNWGTGVWHFAHQKGVVERSGQLQWTIGPWGAAWPK